MIEGHEDQLKKLYAEKRSINNKKGMSKNAKAVKLEPIENDLTMLRQELATLINIKEWKTPFYEKLPKKNQFYSHFMQNLQFTRMRDAAATKAEDERALFAEAIEEMDRHQV